MKKIQVIVNGLPGKMAWAVAEAVINSNDMIFIPRSLTGPEIISKNIIVGGVPVELFGPDEKSLAIIEQADVNIDFTHPSAIVDNVEFYTDHRIPFVMGTTGGDLGFIRKKVSESGINAVVAPNMAKEIVLFQAMLEFVAEKFPGGLKDFSLEVSESHQKGKADTSGTAKAVIASFNKLGIPFSTDQIDKKRTESNYESWGVPREFWEGHGWHTYTLKKPDDSVFLQFQHNVNGRQAYVDGTLDAVRFLNMIQELPFDEGIVFSMIDVLRGK
ncbi:MAG: dihydrodipicolinate reductase C-terminal domain-containing protein [Patescibacteria group bacterium]